MPETSERGVSPVRAIESFWSFQVPKYDASLSEPVVWLRPQELAHGPEYFFESARSGSVVEGRMGDAWFVGALAAISSVVQGID